MELEEELKTEEAYTTTETSESRIVDKYEYDRQTAELIDYTRQQLTIWFVERSETDEKIINTTLEWIAISSDFLEKYKTSRILIDALNSSIELLESYKDISTAKEQFQYAKKIVLRRFDELHLTMTRIPNRGPFREGYKQRLFATGKGTDDR